ncbi:MAG: hypothetical protein ACRDHG_01985 [Anaerolineales bacterium]
MATETHEPESRDASSWARPVSKLRVTDVPSGAVSLNVEGRHVVGPLQGFGQLWQKTYRVRLAREGLTPASVVGFLKEKLPELMPRGARFYPSVSGVAPGELVLINATLPGVPGGIATGVMVLYSDDESFTLMCPEGHPEAGWNTFSAYQEERTTVAQIQSLGRANDPIFEFGFRFLGGAKQQEQTWRHVLSGVAKHYGLEAPVEFNKSLVDGKLQWSQAKNVWFNSAVRSMLYLPVRLIRRLFGRGGPAAA